LSPRAAGQPVLRYMVDEAVLGTIDVDDRQGGGGDLRFGAGRSGPRTGRWLGSPCATRALSSSRAPRESEPLPGRCAVPPRAPSRSRWHDADDATVLMTSGWGHALAAFTAATVAPAFDVSLARDPCASWRPTTGRAPSSPTSGRAERRRPRD